MFAPGVGRAGQGRAAAGPDARARAMWALRGPPAPSWRSRPGARAERSGAALRSHGQEERQLRRQLGALEAGQRRVARARLREQKAFLQQIRLRLQRAELAHARLLGDRERERRLRAGAAAERAAGALGDPGEAAVRAVVRSGGCLEHRALFGLEPDAARPRRPRAPGPPARRPGPCPELDDPRRRVRLPPRALLLALAALERARDASDGAAAAEASRAGGEAPAADASIHGSALERRTTQVLASDMRSTQRPFSDRSTQGRASEGRSTQGPASDRRSTHESPLERRSTQVLASNGSTQGLASDGRSTQGLASDGSNQRLASGGRSTQRLAPDMRSTQGATSDRRSTQVPASDRNTQRPAWVGRSTQELASDGNTQGSTSDRSTQFLASDMKSTHGPASEGSTQGRLLKYIMDTNPGTRRSNKWPRPPKPAADTQPGHEVWAQSWWPRAHSFPWPKRFSYQEPPPSGAREKGGERLRGPGAGGEQRSAREEPRRPGPSSSAPSSWDRHMFPKAPFPCAAWIRPRTSNTNTRAETMPGPRKEALDAARA